eukprot:jgi/Mesvir1/18030/Mv09352-RA.1
MIEDTLLHVLKDKVRCAVKKEQVKARKKTQGKGDLSERVSIIGREAHSVLNSGDLLLDIVFPPGHNTRPVMQGSLDALRGFWEVVARPFEDDGVEGSPVRQGVADMVKAAAIKAADALVKATAAENLTLYYHIAVDHLPAAILKWVVREEAELAKRSLNVIVKNLKMEEGENSEKLARAFEREILDRMGLRLVRSSWPPTAFPARGLRQTKAGQPVYWKGAAIYVGHKPWQATPAAPATPDAPA